MGRSSLSKRLSVIVLCFSVAGCTVKTSYRFLDWIIAWQFDDYISLNSEQQPVFDRQLSELLSWHQTTQLMLYRQWLIEGRALFQQPLQFDQLSEWLNQSSFFWRQLMEQLSPSAAQLLALLSDEQVTTMTHELRAALAEDRQSYQQQNNDKAGSVQDRQRHMKHQSAKTVKQFRRWLGGLSFQQRQWINEWVALRADTQGLWLDNREQWLNDFEQLLAERQSRDFETALGKLLIETAQRRSKRYSSALEENSRSFLGLVIQLQASLSARQTRHLNNEIDTWIEVLEELANP